MVSIQILRALAAFGVLIGHLWTEFARFGDQTFPNLIVGAAGVDLFFVISGFVMVYSSEPFFAQPGGPRTFLLRRLARIVPLYWTATTVALIYLLWSVFVRGRDPAIHDLSWQVIYSSYAFLPWPRPSGATHAMLSIGWTLNFEMFFYVVFAAAVILPRRWAVIAVTVFFVGLIQARPYLGMQPPNPFVVYANEMIYEFVYGMWIALAFRGGWRIPVWLSALFVTIGCGMIAWTGMDASGVTIIPRHILWGGAGALMVAGVVLADSRRPVPGAAAKGMSLLGDASYALYHLSVLNADSPNSTAS